MADYLERRVTRTFTEWRIPVRSLGSLPEWAKLQIAITDRVGVELAEQHGVLETCVEGDGDDQVLVLSFEHKEHTVVEMLDYAVDWTDVDLGVISAYTLTRYATDHGFSIELLRGETAFMVNRLGVLLGLDIRDQGSNGISGRVGKARWVAVSDIPPNMVRVGDRVYRLGENDNRLTYVPIGA